MKEQSPTGREFTEIPEIFDPIKAKIIEPQERYGWCGPACLRAAAVEQGVPCPDQGELVAMMGTDEMGTSHVMMETAARLLGLDARWVFHLGFEELNKLREQGHTIVINWMSGHDDERDGHYSLVAQVTADRVVLHDPEGIGSVRIIERGRLEEKWYDLTRDGSVVNHAALVLIKREANQE